MVNTRTRPLAISWESHRRMQELCAALGVPLHILISKLPGPLRHLELSVRTLVLLALKRPRIVLVQNPSIVLTALCASLARVLGFKLIVDAHNEAVQPFIHDTKAVRAVARWLHQRADLTIVTNDSLADIVRAAGGKTLVLHDRLPVTKAALPATPTKPLHIAVICTYEPDEPLAEVVRAAGMLEQEARFHLTGNFRKLDPALRNRAPANVRFTGFLIDADYWKLLRDCDVVLDLSTMNNCLVCGAYEGLATGRPLILTDTSVARQLFTGPTVFTGNSAPEIAGAVFQCINEYRALSAAVDPARRTLSALWEQRAQPLQDLIDG